MDTVYGLVRDLQRVELMELQQRHVNSMPAGVVSEKDSDVAMEAVDEAYRDLTCSVQAAGLRGLKEALEIFYIIETEA